jgi:serine/threonine protein kinase/tetratricopeptide (TPR) repeat protein
MADSSSDREPLEQLAESFLARFRAGERPSLTEIIAAHPELGDQIRSLFPALVEMEQAGSAIGPATGSAAPGPLPGTARLEALGDFRIIREVGRGGMGVVYEAIQESLGRHVALKVFAPWARADPKLIERFQREARAAARLHHTNIVPVFGVGAHGAHRYYAMQFIQGQGLDAILQELRRLRSTPEPDGAGPAPPESTRSVPLAATVAHSLLTGRFAGPAREPGAIAVEAHADGSAMDYELHPPAKSPAPAGGESSSDASVWASQPGASYARTIARVGFQVAEALAHAHGQGILHRDIKPSNLLLDVEGSVWVTDFGLAKADDAEALTEAGDIVGTVRYMAPERFRGESGPACDVYGLGVTLYELLTLRPAFDEGDRARLIDHILHTDPPPPRAVDPKIPRDLETICLKCLEKEPARRYASAQALAADLTRWLSGEPIDARPVGPATRTWMWCRRHPLPAGLAALLALAIVGGLAGVTWKWREAARAGAIAAKINTFLTQKLLAQAAPLSNPRGASLAVGELLDRTSAQLGREFDGQPEVEAAIRETLGSTYQSLALYEKARPHFEAAVKLNTRLHGPHARQTLRAVNLLTALRDEAGEQAEVEPLMRRNLEDCARSLGPGDLVTLDAEYQLGLLLWHLRKLDESERRLRDSLKARRRVLGAQHPDTLRSINHLGLLLQERGSLGEAEALALEYEHGIRCLWGTKHPDYVTALTNRARLRLNQGNLTEAELLYQKAANEAVRIFGPEHPQTLAAIENHARVLTRIGRKQEAAEVRSRKTRGLDADREH